MKVQFESHTDYVAVTVVDDDHARAFCELAAQVVCDCETYADVPADLKRIYAEYGQRQAAEDTLHWDRRLWDYVVRKVSIGPVTVKITFGYALMQRLGLI